MTPPGRNAEHLEGRPRRPGSVVLLVLAAGSVVAVGAIWLVVPPRYTAEAWIECISDRLKEAQTLVRTAPLEDEHERFINSQAQLVKSPEVLNDVLKTPEVRSTHWFNELDEEDRFLELFDTLSSAPIRDTNYIRVSIGCRQKQDPAKIVQQVVLRYYNLVQTKAKDNYRDQLNEYQNQAAQLNDQIKAKIEAIREFQAKLPAGATLDAPSIPYRELEVLSEQVAALELQTNELQGLNEIYSDPAGLPVSPEDREAVEQDPLICRLKNEELSLELEQASLLDAPEDQQTQQRLARKLAAVQQKLAELRSQRLAEVQSTRREQLRIAFQSSQHKLFLTREQKAEAEADQADLDRQRAELATLYDELEFLKKERDDTVAFVRQIQSVMQEKQAVQVGIVRAATEPQEPDRTLPIWLTVVASAPPVLFGLGLVPVRLLAARRARL